MHISSVHLGYHTGSIDIIMNSIHTHVHGCTCLVLRLQRRKKKENNCHGVHSRRLRTHNVAISTKAKEFC